ncbi:MAG TPA: hypothetical protein VFV93_07635, partial [Thermomicrobiales bacterium]|nr:hypothetical protein [Thermomicrobiales bacterium]
IAVIASDLATGKQVEVARNALCCAAVQPDGRVTWYATDGIWMRDPRSDAPATLVWPKTESSTQFIGLLGDWAVRLQVIETEGKYSYYEHVQLVARQITTGESTVLDDGWKWYDTQSFAGIVGTSIAYPRLYPSPADAERAGDWLAV